jgi:hypothetical protein
MGSGKLDVQPMRACAACSPCDMQTTLEQGPLWLLEIRHPIAITLIKKLGTVLTRA